MGYKKKCNQKFVTRLRQKFGNQKWVTKKSVTKSSLPVLRQKNGNGKWVTKKNVTKSWLPVLWTIFTAIVRHNLLKVWWIVASWAFFSETGQKGGVKLLAEHGSAEPREKENSLPVFLGAPAQSNFFYLSILTKLFRSSDFKRNLQEECVLPVKWEVWTQNNRPFAYPHCDTAGVAGWHTGLWWSRCTILPLRCTEWGSETEWERIMCFDSLFFVLSSRRSLP